MRNRSHGPPSPLRARGFVLLAVLPCLAALGCQGVDTTGERSDGFLAPDRSMVVETAVDALRTEGFTTDSSASSPEQGVVVTRHRLSLQPFSGHGFREKATVRIHEVPD